MFEGGVSGISAFFSNRTDVSVAHIRTQIELSAPAYTIQHDPDIWGDPEVFRPERWLEEESGSAGDADTKGRPEGSELKKYLLTFGMGPRACIGKK